MTSSQMASQTQALSQALALERAGEHEGAQAAYRAIVSADPGCHVAWHALGLLAFNAGKLPLAVQCIEAAIEGDRSVALYHRNVGEMHRRLGQLDRAVQAGRLAVKLAPDDLDAHYNLALAYTDAQDHAKAIEGYRRALAINPAHGLSWNNLGSSLGQLGQTDEALHAYLRAIELNPRHAEAQCNAGAIYSEQGQLDKARACFEAALEVRPDFVEVHYNLSSLKTYTRDDPHVAVLEDFHARRASLGERARIRYDFALGKALEDIGDHDRAFAAYEEGNRLQHALLPVDEQASDRLLARILAVFNADFFAARRGWVTQQVPDARRPIFIVGMPRSGTTLLEQILSSHPSVHGAGELMDLSVVIDEATGAGPGRAFTEGVHRLTEADVRRIGEAYLRRVWKLSPDSLCISDKMPGNFFYLGLIHLALPQARIIHAMRDPMDSCFSCYSRLFNDTMAFTYDLRSLGRYHARYMALMRHWRQVLPEGTVLDLRYEDMVADTEGQARRVLDFVGLPWDERCLKFHENTRRVRTASVAQVRKPIYQTSVARWKPFAKHLRPLYELVKADRPDDGADSLFQHAPVEDKPTAESLHLEGIAHYKADRLDAALRCYDGALALRPHFPAALNSRGFVLQDMDRLDEALADFAQAVALAPQMSMARLNLGMAQLKLGQFEQGWDNYEARWTGSAEANSGSFARPNCHLPHWQGQGDTQHQRLLLIGEQGFGDTFQFSRYLPLLAQRFAKVGFVCAGRTQRLMEWSFGERIVTFCNLPADTAGWDLQCALMSLPRAFQTRLDSIPAQVPYLRVPEVAQAHWRERLDQAAPGRLRVGLAWAGRKAHQRNARRSLRFEQVRTLLNQERVSWVSLQKWAPEDERPEVPGGVHWLDWTDEQNDFADAAALVANLDLVISIDSAMVHLAGALGRPVWMLDRFDNEWRWLHHRVDSPWYPGLRLFRQPAFGEWGPVLDAVRQALSAWVNSAASRSSAASTASVSARSSPSPVVPLGLSAEQAMQLAAQHQGAGRLGEAEAVLQAILNTEPRHAQALHLMGVVAYQTGHRDRAMALIRQAIDVDPGQALFHSNLAEMSRQQGQLAAAIEHGQRAVDLDPSLVSAHANLGVAWSDANDLDRAVDCHQRALALHPGLAQSLNNLGSIARLRKDRPAAADWYRQALASSPDYLEAMSNLGAVLVELDQPDEAVPVLERALQRHPDYAEALCNLGLARLKQERAQEAEGLLRRSLQRRPGYAQAMSGLARALHDQGRVKEALPLLREVTTTHPDLTDAWCLLGTVSNELDQPDDAEQAYLRAIELDPEWIDALIGLGHLRLEQGKVDEAEHLVRRALAVDPQHVAARFHLSQARKVKPGDENLAALEALLVQPKAIRPEELIWVHYALGKSYDDLQAWDQAFPHFMEGARLKRAKLDYDGNVDAARTHRLEELMSLDTIERLRGGGDPSEVPIFVLGMPRSGTTLTEQIIASHPEVHGAGELHDLLDITRQPVRGQPERPWPDNLAGLTRETLTAWGQDYVARLRARAPQARRITDKLPANYLSLGLIPLMLPKARIIHVRRNAADTCVSCFTRLFNRGQDATYDLAELGRHYANYARLMDHWRQVLPEGSFLEVQYEDIVADMPGQARRLIDWCGLDWHDDCLAFHKTERTIRTASIMQVRQPIYSSSVARWRHYEAYLKPLLDALGEWAPGP